jgi:hypothetical protein
MKVKTIAYIHYIKYNWETKGEFCLFSCKLDDDDSRTYVCEQEVEIEVPENFDPRPNQIAALKAKKRKAMADYQRTVDEINDRISKLQALEFTA